MKKRGDGSDYDTMTVSGKSITWWAIMVAVVSAILFVACSLLALVSTFIWLRAYQYVDISAIKDDGMWRLVRPSFYRVYDSRVVWINLADVDTNANESGLDLKFRVEVPSISSVCSGAVGFTIVFNVTDDLNLRILRRSLRIDPTTLPVNRVGFVKSISRDALVARVVESILDKTSEKWAGAYTDPRNHRCHHDIDLVRARRFIDYLGRRRFGRVSQWRVDELVVSKFECKPSVSLGDRGQ